MIHCLVSIITILVVVQITIYGEYSNKSSRRYGSPAGVDTINMNVLVPAYFDPSSSDCWSRMSTQAEKMSGRLYAIANKDSGPGSYDSTYTNAINSMHANTGKVIGYVYTNYGAIGIDAVKSDIDKWYSYYPTLDGIFLDCQDNVTGKEAYYIEIYNYIKQKDSTALVVSNPGTNTIENYLVYNGQRVSDVDCIFEVNTGFNSWIPSSWCSKYSSDNFYVIPYNTPSNEYVGVVNRAHQLNVGWIYCTNSTLPNPYNTLPTYFEEFCNYIITGIYTPIPGQNLIQIDGNFDDWQNVPVLNISPNPPDSVGESPYPDADYINFWAVNDTSNLYLSYELGGTISSNYFYHIFIDADANPNTGYVYNDSASIGAEFMVENDILYKYTGKGGADWSWSQISEFSKANSGGRTEMSIPLDILFSTVKSNVIRLIFETNSSTSPYTQTDIDPFDYKNKFYTYSLKTVTGVNDKSSEGILTFNLSQNYPNPFNPSTLIQYRVPAGGLVTLKVFDVLGREIRTLVNEYRSGGNYTVSFDASKFASGIYFYQLRSGNYVSTKKMLLLK
jgi:hypothetical protein